MMDGFLNRALQCFVRDIYGADQWDAVVSTAHLGFSEFEAMLTYDPSISERVITALEVVLNKPRIAVYEDLGTYLVSHEHMEAVRRLLRFGGEDFEEFLMSLDELPDRARLALAEFDLPSIQVQAPGFRIYILSFGAGLPGFLPIMMGVLRAMADDYGALVFMEYAQSEPKDQIVVTLADSRFSDGRDFELAPYKLVQNG